MQIDLFQNLPLDDQRELIRAVLKTPARMVVLGLSAVSARPSYGVTEYMISQGYEVFGVRPASPSQILGRPCLEHLRDLHEAVDIIDVFRNPDALPSVLDDIRAWLKTEPMADRLEKSAELKRPVCLWLQEGVADAKVERAAIELGLIVISDRCIS